jgi:hypothetical protein
MKHVIITFIVVAGIVACVAMLRGGNEGARQAAEQRPRYDRSAMVKAWNECVEIENAMDPKANNLRAQYGKLANVGTDGCSPAFKNAYLEYLSAMSDLTSTYETMPKDFGEGVLAGAVNFLTKGEMDGGGTRMQNEWKERVRALDNARNRFKLSIGDE